MTCKPDPRALKIWKKQWTPRKIVGVQEWAEEHIHMPTSATPIPGKYSSSPTPHVREVLKAYTDPDTTYIILRWAAQSAKTTTELICKCYNIANYDGNQIFLMPSQDMAKSYSETKLQPIIEASPILKDLKPRKFDKFKKLEMHMANGVLNLIGGSSAANLASRSAGRLFTDEINKLKAELVGEADPLSLLFERAKWFPDKKIFLTSTPTTPEGHIDIWFAKGTQEHPYFPCPDCSHMFYPEWYKHMKWESGPEEEEWSPEKRAATAYLECPECQFHIKDKHKYNMLNAIEWRAHNLKATKEMRSFHYNEIMSHITKWKDLTLKFLRAIEKKKTGDLSELKNFVNSSLGEPWLASAGQTMSADDVDAMTDLNRNRGEVPRLALGLVAGIDTQDNGYYYVIRAFGAYNTSWLITDGFVDSLDTLEQVVFHSEFPVIDSDGNEIRKMRVSKAYQDAGGHKTDEVYRFCRKWMHMNIPCMGRGKNQQSEYTWVSVDKAPGKNVIGGLQRCVWNTVTIKDLMFNKMKVDQDQPGSFHIHNQTSVAYRKALRSEFKNEKGDYEHIRHIENHYLDCEALTFLGARLMGIEYWSDQQEVNTRPETHQTPQNQRKPW